MYNSQVGYRSFWWGKGHTGYKSWRHLPKNLGFSAGFYGFLAANQPHNQPSRWLDNRIIDTPSPTPFSTLDYGRRILQAIDAHNVSEPMFMFFAWQDAHTPYDCSRLAEIDMAKLAREQKCDGREKIYSSCCMYALLKQTDATIGRISWAIQQKGMWGNSLVVLASDNGGHKGGMNYPLRGQKGTNFEGGIRSATFVSGGLLPMELRGTVNPIVFSITDWYPTFCKLAGVDPTDDPIPGTPHGDDKWPSIDGVDIWPMLTRPKEHSTDSAHKALAVTSQVIVAGRYKLIHSQPYAGMCRGEACSSHQQPDGSWVDNPGGLRCNKLGGDRWHQKVPCIFDVESDPREMRDIAEENPRLQARLMTQLAEALRTSFTPSSPPELVGPCNEMCALQYYKRTSSSSAFLSMRQENVVHARDPEVWESTDPLYPLSTAELAVMGIELPEGLSDDWTATEMAAAEEVGDMWQVSAPQAKVQQSAGAFSMRTADISHHINNTNGISLLRGSAEGRIFRYPRFVQIGDFPICGIPGCL